jgi:hypothetical protein
MQTYSIPAGFAGAGALTLIHQSARLVTDKAPRMDILGQRALRPLVEKLGFHPGPTSMQMLALAGDLLSNTLYYAAVGAGRPRNLWLRGLSLGMAAGLGAITLPQRMGLGIRPQARTNATRVMAFSWYTLGGLVAAGVLTLARRPHSSARLHAVP